MVFASLSFEKMLRFYTMHITKALDQVCYPLVLFTIFTLPFSSLSRNRTFLKQTLFCDVLCQSMIRQSYEILYEQAQNFKSVYECHSV